MPTSLSSGLSQMGSFEEADDDEGDFYEPAQRAVATRAVSMDEALLEEAGKNSLKDVPMSTDSTLGDSVSTSCGPTAGTSRSTFSSKSSISNAGKRTISDGDVSVDGAFGTILGEPRDTIE